MLVKPAKTLTLTLGLLFAFCVLFSHTEPLQSAGIAQKVESILKKAKLGKHAKVGIFVVDLENGEVLFSKNSDAALIPASNQKLLTTAAALDQLGKDFQLKTELYYSGFIQNHVLHGDLAIVGYGDPTLTTHNDHPAFKHLIQELEERGIQQVQGKLYYDDSYFEGDPRHQDWPEGQYLRSYEAEVSALNLNQNCITIVVTPSAPGKSAHISLEPDTSYVRMTTNNSKTVAGKSDPIIGWTRELESNDLKVWGKIASGRQAYRGECTIHNPAGFFAQQLLENLADQGISVDKGSQHKAILHELKNKDTTWKLLKRQSSDLPSTLYTCNSKSQNLYAECLFRIVARESGQAGSFEGGQKAIKAFLKQKALALQDLVISDGSGLARSNRISTRNLVKLLQYMEEHDDFMLYKGSLAISGKEGTLRKRLKGSKTKGRVFAKTGTLRAVSGLSGYLDTEKGKHYAFSILINGVPSSVARQTIDKIVEQLARH